MFTIIFLAVLSVTFRQLFFTTFEANSSIVACVVITGGVLERIVPVFFTILPMTASGIVSVNLGVQCPVVYLLVRCTKWFSQN